MARSQIVDLIMFDGASNVQIARKIIAQHHPGIAVYHGAEHVVAHFFLDAYNKVSIPICLYFSFLMLDITKCYNDCSRTVCSLQEFVKFLQAMQEYMWVHATDPMQCSESTQRNIIRGHLLDS
jgi:hypothetical protein